MVDHSRPRVWTEAGLAAASAFLCVLTLTWPDWIEAVFGVRPDGGSGALEWVIAVGLLGLTCLFAALVGSYYWRSERRPIGGLTRN